MAEIKVAKTMAASDISEGYGRSGEGSADEALLLEPVRGVRDGALPPFVNNLYNVVNNKDTDSIISWVLNLNLAQSGNHVSSGATSFVIWNNNEFMNNVLPLMSRSLNDDVWIKWKEDDGELMVDFSLDSRFETSWAKLAKDVIKSNLTYLRHGTSALSKFNHDTKLVLYPLQDKLTLGDKSLD
ncbi:winged helix-turn-helix DNA-binding domain, heat shock transcription factor family protein [Tanacetum coccineum]